MKKRYGPLQWGHDLAVVESAGVPTLRETPPGGFNGATTSRSWNPRPRTRTRRGGGCGFNGATTSRSWNPASRPVRPWSRPRFNGATTSRSWNLGLRCAGWGRSVEASMGPRPRGRGIRRTTLVPSHSSRASMGPRPRGRGILTAARVIRVGETRLQWGHDLAVVESPWGDDPILWVLDASMGPRPRGRGIGGTVVEGRVVSPTSFNGATTSRSWNPSQRLRGRPRQPASMGPRPRGRGISTGVHWR